MTPTNALRKAPETPANAVVEWELDTRYVPNEQFVARLQPFSPGGFEGTCYFRDRDAHRHNPLQFCRATPIPRSKTAVAEDKARRAKTRVRHIAREIQADHLLTLTTREASNDPHELLDRFARFVELYRKANSGRELLYVAVPEPHPTNPSHWHVHVAVHGRINVNVARGIWWALCGGRGLGNVDARWIRVRAGMDRSMRCAGYISKYIAKGFAANPELGGRHRYRSSRISLAARGLLVLKARSVHEAIDALLMKLDIERGDVAIFIFPDYSGFWLSCSGNLAEKPPPF